MRIIFLNIWHGTCKPALTTFIEQEAPVTDVFCFQEADSDIREHLRTALPAFTEHAHFKPGRDGHTFSLVTFVKPPAHTTHTYSLLEHISDTGLALVTTIQHDNGAVTVANVHGIAYRPDDKLDSPSRLEQSHTIIESLHASRYPTVIGGDFNMLPEASSVRMFTEAGYHDLIASHHIKTTRNHLAWNRYPGHVQYYSDYVFTSPGVHVRSFAVPDLEVSDHLPLIVEFDLAEANRQ